MLSSWPAEEASFRKSFDSCESLLEKLSGFEGSFEEASLQPAGTGGLPND